MSNSLLDNIEKLEDISKLPGAIIDKDGVITVSNEEIIKAQVAQGLLSPREAQKLSFSSMSVEEMTDRFLSGKMPRKEKRDIRSLLEDKVVQRVGRKGKYITDKLFELIDGIYVVDSVKKDKRGGEIRYYKKEPNLQAIQYALDRVLGKPKQVQFTSSFSLSKLLIEHNGSGPGNNTEIQEKSSIFHRENMETDSAEG